MCYNTKISRSTSELKNRFKAMFPGEDWFSPSETLNGFAHPKMPVITNDNPEMIQGYTWGLIPTWAGDDSIQKNTLNARIETVETLASFKSVAKNRCLVLADGFYEWKWLDAKGKSKQKFLLNLPDNSPFAFAGIWSHWVDKSNGELRKTFSILTTEANELMAEIHNTKKRMPVVLTPENERHWLHGADVKDFTRPEVDLFATEV